MSRSLVPLCLVFVAASFALACGSKSPTPTTATPLGQASDPSGARLPGPNNGSPALPLPPEIPPGSGTAVLLATADIGWCGSEGVGLTARLLQSLSGQILLVGDLAYMHGRAEEFKNCFDPEYGRFRSRWRPIPGNHEYSDPGANGYFTYFGDAAGPARRGYYSFDAAAWRVLMLDSAQPAALNSPQYLWARDELLRYRTRCTMAVWHHPYVSSGPNGPNLFMRDIWTLLYDNNAEVVVSGHDHFYERFGPQTAAQQPDPQRGIRQFIAGTGGAPLYRPVTRFPNSEVVVEAWGVLRLTLHPSSYDWEFIEAATNTASDRGAALCH
jgi:acid phosphatase type 7